MKTKTYTEYEVEVKFEGILEPIFSTTNEEKALEAKEFYEKEDPDAEEVKIKVYAVIETDELKFAIDRNSRNILSRSLIKTM